MVLSADSCAVVLVNFNNASYTLRCLNALLSLCKAPLYTVVVDNASTTEDAQSLYQGWCELWQKYNLPAPQVHSSDSSLSPSSAFFLPLPTNSGFAGGNNAAMRLLLKTKRCSAFWLLNNDTEPAPEALDALCAHMNGNRDMGLCGSTVVFAHSPDLLQCAGGGVLSSMLGTVSLLHENAECKAALSLDCKAVEKKLDFILGASLLIRCELVDRIGLMAEEYFLYYEEVDYAVAARRAGYSLGWAQQSVVLHHEGATTSSAGGGGGRAVDRPAFIDYLVIRNRFYFLRKWYPWALPLALLSLSIVFYRRWRRGQLQRWKSIVRATMNGITGNMNT